MASLLPALLPPLSPCSKTELLPLLPRTNLLSFFVPTRSPTQPALRRLLASATTSLSAPPGPNPHTINTPIVRIVYVVLEAQYQSSLSAAAQSLNSSRFPACIQISGYLVEDLRKEVSFRRFCDDLSTANIFIGSLIFVEDIAEKVRSAVEQERPRLDAVLIFPSMPDLMRLNKLGSFSLPQLRRSQNPLVQLLGWKKSSGFADAMLKLLRSLPKVLKYLPSDKARDARHYILGLQFWLCASPENLQNFLKMLCGRYSPALKPQKLDFGEPVLLPESGIWHPSAPRMFEDLSEYLNWYKSRGRRDLEESPVIGLMLQRSHIVSGDEAHYTAVIEELEGKGASAVAIFCAGLDFSGPVQKYFVDEAKGGAVVHAAVSLTGFALVGGPARQDRGRAVEVLRKLDVPYLVGLPLVLQTTEEWESSDLGLHPVQVALQVALPELEGGIEPIVFSGRHAKTGKSHALPKRVEKLCARAIKWADLKRKPKEEKKVAITAFCFPPDKGNVGTAAYLNVFSSIFSVVGELKKDGYHVSDFPSSADSLLREITGEDHPARSSPSLRVAYRMPVREYKYLTPFASALEPSWGKPPGTLNSDGESLLIHGKQYGNIFIGVQPSFGYEGDPMRLLFSRSASPHHGFAAYYSFIRAVFAADAVIHFGTHGALEFMPGKQVGMSDDCFPDLLIGSIPNIYFYAVNNPSEATIAKRRSYASTISYATPPAEYAGLYKGLKQISDLISSYGSLKHAGRRGQQIVGSIISTAIQCNLDKDVRLPPSATELSTEEMDLVVGKVYSKIMEIESRLIPCGLHVIGEPPSVLETAMMLAGIAEIDRPEDGISSLTGILADSVGRKTDDLHRGSAAGILDDVEILGEIRDASQGAIGAFLESVAKKTGRPAMLGFSAEPWIEYLSRTKFKKADKGKLRDVFRFLGECLGLLTANNELGNLKRALEGGYVEPGPGGDPIRNPKVLPTGRNMHALDPQAIPTEAAMESAKEVVDGLLERQKVDNGGRYPETVAVVLWGTDNIKTYGESLAQVMWMIGVRPIPDAFGRVNRVEPVCLDELRRPRIDVVVNCSGVFRDLFINQMNLLDRAVKTVAELAEPTEQNYVRKHALEQAAELGVPVQEAATRVFSNAAGSYSSNVGLAVENSSWNDERQLQEMYLSRKSFAFDSDAPSGGGAGMTAKRRLFETALRTAEATFQNLDSSEISVTDVSHYFDLDPTNVVRSLRRDGKKPGSYVADGGKVRTVAEAVRLDVRTKLLNPRWQEGVLRMGYEGVREIERRLTCTVGWSATSGEVDNWVYEEANQSFIGNEGMLRRLMEANPRSFQRMVQTFLEASGRGYWDTSSDNLHRLRSLYSRLEDTIEGVFSPLPPSSSSCLK